MRVYKNKGCRK